MSSKFPTLRDCLRELGRRIEQDHGPTCVAAAQNLQAPEMRTFCGRISSIFFRKKMLLMRPQNEKDAADASTKRSRLAQARTVSCITPVLVWLGGFHTGALGTLL
jgi:hypothetical protein